MSVTFNNAPFSDGSESSLKARTGVFGIPYDFGSTTRSTGQADGPRAVRLSYQGPPIEGLVDLGDLDLGEDPRSQTSVLVNTSEQVEVILAEEVDRLIVYGGDDSISYGVLAGMNDPQLIHFDAHDDYGDGDNVDHANWVARAVNEGLLSGLEQHDMRAPDSKVRPMTWNREPKSTCLVVDLDVFDPSVAPGVAVPEPLGTAANIQWRHIRDAMKRYNPDVLVITELTPQRDVNEMTARLAFRMGYHFASL